MRIKMLRKLEDGSIETYYIENAEEKKLIDKEKSTRHKLRRLNELEKQNLIEKAGKEKKGFYQKRQNTTKKLREIIQQNSNNKNNDHMEDKDDTGSI